MVDLLKDLEAVAANIETAESWNCTGDQMRCFDGTGCECAMQGRDRPDAEGDAVNFIRTHHAEIAEAMRDAALWRYLVRENNKGGRGAFRIVWFDERDDGFTTTDGVSVDGKDDQAIIRIVSDAMHNSAREAGE